MADVHYQELSEIKGLPSLDDLRNWRRLVQQETGDATFELVGVREAEGQLIGIFRRKGETDA